MKNSLILAGKKIITYRWMIGVVLWISLVFMQLHGSSIGMYAELLHDPATDCTLLGHANKFQLDEWAVFTPLSFSQYFDGFTYYSHLPRAALTDVALVYGQPCFDIITLFRPFLWGYLFLPVANGLSFFWIGRLIMLFLVSYEFGSFLLYKKTRYAFLYTVLITFSPIVQAWFNTNSFVEMLIWGQIGILLMHKYISTKSYYKRTLFTVLLAYCIVAYSVSIYPAWQVSFGYVFLSLVGWVIYQNRQQNMWTFKDFLLAGPFFMLICFPLSHIIIQSWDTIQAFLNTAYPGKRYIPGGDFSLQWLMVYAASYVAPFGLFVRYAPTAVSSFLSFSPLGIIFALWQYKKYKYSDGLVWIFTVLTMVYVVYFLVPWPQFLAKDTLLSMVPPPRIIPAIDFMQLIILLRVLAGNYIAIKDKMLIPIVLLYGGFVLVCIHALFIAETKYLGMAIVFFISTLVPIYLFKYKKSMIIFFLSISFLSAMVINPVSHGVSSVYGTTLANNIMNITNVDKGKWLVDNNTTWNTDKIYYMNSYPIMFGGPTVNSVNFYPYWPRWESLHIDEKQRDVLNRYVHMNVTLVQEGVTDFQNPSESSIIQDKINIHLNINDLQKMDVHYILTERDLTLFSNDKVQFFLQSSANGFNVYTVSYS